MTEKNSSKKMSYVPLNGFIEDNDAVKKDRAKAIMIVNQSIILGTLLTVVYLLIPI